MLRFGRSLTALTNERRFNVTTTVLVDGVTFQAARRAFNGWSDVLRRLGKEEDLQVHLLDRGGAPLLEGVRRWPFASLPVRCEARAAPEPFQPAADSCLVQQMCDMLVADVFLSTGYTTPLATPSLSWFTDAADAGCEDLERQRTLSHAETVLCGSLATRHRLATAFPQRPAQWLAGPLRFPIQADGEAAWSLACRALTRLLVSLPARAARPSARVARAEWSILRTLQRDLDVEAA